MTNEKKETKSSGNNPDEGSKLPTDEQIKRTNEAAERLEKATDEARVFGVAEAGMPPKKHKETDEEYAERFARGDVNPLKDVK